jgi:hypothetical protein
MAREIPMKSFQFTTSSVAALLTISLLVGCGDKSAEKPSAQQSTTSSASESDHGDSHKVEGHGHGTGPHDGTIADWGGGKFHVEFTVDHDRQEATAYVFGSDEKTPVPITAETLLLTIKKPQLQMDLLPVPLENETDGKSSRFVGTHDGLATVMEYEGIMSAEVDGTPYAGNFKEEAHGAHAGQGHSHGAADALVWEGEPKSHAGLVIKLGHHGKQLHAGEEVEPAVSITRNGEAVDDTRVFNALLSTDGKTQLTKEVATVYEPTTAEEPAHYAQGALAIPQGVTGVVIRFRVVPSGADEVTFDVPIRVE